MTQGDADAVRRTCVVHVRSPSDVVAAAYAAGLAADGWRTARAAVDAGGGPWPNPAALVLVVDESGRLPDVPTTHLTAARSVVVVAGRSTGRTLLHTVERRAAVVDADQPLEAQLRAVASALVHPHVEREVVAATVRAWVHDAELVAQLTAREAEVLDLLMQGHSAASTADSLVLTVTTVRTHIQAILRKLQVSSQMAAVAVACRAQCVPGGRRCRSPQS